MKFEISTEDGERVTSRTIISRAIRMYEKDLADKVFDNMEIEILSHYVTDGLVEITISVEE
ncbi:MAG: hypothetical protein GQ474_01160 [Sulfurimonas sp.]|nr:hypothetical protein [Sulfurimonas sp.]